MGSLLEVKDLATYFYTDEGIIKALDGVSFSIDEGEILGLVGETGCGKSVTATSIMGLIPSPPGKVVRGSILFNGRELLSLSERQMRRIRGREIAMIFQDPASSLNPVFRVGFQVAEAIWAHLKTPIREALLKAAELFGRVNIPDPLAATSRYPHQLSGGMKQRVMIAMALSLNPKLLIADEPTTALDVSIQAQILSLIKRLQRDYGSSVLLISHDLGVISTMAHRVAVMYSGLIVEEGRAEDLFQKPLHPYTQGLLAAIPRVDEDKSELAVIEGTIPDLTNPPAGCRFHPRCPWVMKICEAERPPLKTVEPKHKVACHAYAG